jgi:hypothetical protein
MIRGRAFDTIVEARIDTNRPSSRPESAWTTSRCDILAVVVGTDVIALPR